MTFANPLLVWGTLAAAIPLVLHILNRSRFRRVEWGAMHLLESVVRINHKRFRVEQLLLLLIRCAIPALLAICLARPLLTGGRNPAGDSPVSLVVLLDTSYSMDAVTGTRTHFDDAVYAACQIVEAAARGSEIAVIQTGGSPELLFDQPLFDADAVVRRLKVARSGYGASEMLPALDAGLATLSKMTNPTKELVVISDFQPADWNRGGNLADSVRDQVAAMSIPPELTLLPVGKPVQGNVSIESLQLPERPMGIDQQISVRAGVRNYGTTPVESARIVLTLDGTEQVVSQVTLAANASAQVLLPCLPSGSHVIDVGIAVDDLWPRTTTFPPPFRLSNRLMSCWSTENRIRSR
ncbi:MAG: BatA domain-containing protein [Planctomycetaceae bacterium]